VPTDLLVVLGIAAACGGASIAGGLVALAHRPSTLVMSLAFGFAGGALTGTVTLELLPRALSLAPLPIAVAGFAAGFLGIYVFDLAVHGGHVAGEKAEQHRRVTELQERMRLRAAGVAVLAGGTSIEEIVEGVTIGVGAAILPGSAALVALGIAIDNLSEGVSIGEMIREEEGSGQRPVGRVLGWTSLVAGSLVISTILGWLALRGLPQQALGFIFALGGGGLLYLTLTNLVPAAEQRQYQRSSALAAGCAFALIFVLSGLLPE
jgi:ZIP family zinc transporter